MKLNSPNSTPAHHHILSCKFQFYFCFSLLHSPPVVTFNSVFDSTVFFFPPYSFIVQVEQETVTVHVPRIPFKVLLERRTLTSALNPAEKERNHISAEQ